MTSSSNDRFGGTSFAQHVQGIDPFAPSSKEDFNRAASGDIPPSGGGSDSSRAETENGSPPRPPSPNGNLLKAAQKRATDRQNVQSFDLTR